MLKTNDAITYYITGIGGFLGENILIELEKQSNIKIIGFILPKEKEYPWLKRDNITLIEGNILSKDDVHRFLSTESNGKKVVIHAAGRITTVKNGDKITYDINYGGTKNVVDVINELNTFDKLVYVSSVDALPRRKDKENIFEVDRFDNKLVDGVYSKSKADSNNYVLDNCHINCSIVMPSAMIGPNDHSLTPINNAINRLIHKKLPAITKGGYNIADVRDVAKGIISCVYNGTDKQSYILSGEYISVKDLMDTACEMTNQKKIKTTVPHFLIKLISPFIELHAKIHHKTPLFTGFSMDCLKQNSNYNYKKAREELNYSSRPLNESIRDTIDYLQSL